MTLDGELRGESVHVAGDARQRFYDSRGYGRPLEGNAIALSRAEAAHLLFRGDLGSVRVDGDDLDFEAFFAASATAGDRFALRFLVYSDLRDRGFYISPNRDGWPGDDPNDAVDFAVFDRGTDPEDGQIAYRIRVVGEREHVPAAGLAGTVLAIVDEESDLTYFEATIPDLDGGTEYDSPEGLVGTLLDDRVVVWDAPESLYEHGFYGQPLTARAAQVEGALQLSLLEAASLAGDGRLALRDEDGAAGDAAGARETIVARGRAVEGDRFDRRLTVYEDLRGRRMVPKTGYKFGADFRTYETVETVEDLPHSEQLVRVVEPDHVFDPRALSLDVRLAGGVRKRMVFALTDASFTDYLSVARLTP